MEKIGRRILNIPTTLAVVIGVYCLQQCSKPVEPSIADVTKGKITAWVWKANSVTDPSGVDVTSQFAGFTILFINADYTATKGAPIWPATDKWSLKGQSTSFIRTSDNLEIGIESIEATSLKLIVPWDKTTYNGGRVNSIQGNYHFNLIKQ